MINNQPLNQPIHGWQLLVLIASGTAALIFQILWIKQLALVVGVDVHAITTGVGAFFTGLALGGLIIGRWADRTQRPLRLYVFLELGVAVLGILTTIALSHTAGWFAELEARSWPLAWTLIFILVGTAPFLMGGTLPAIIRSLSLPADKIGSGGGRMYAANTAGAIIGALSSSFLLIPNFGIHGAATFAAGIGICAAACALWLDQRTQPLSPVEQQPINTTQLAKSAPLAVLCYAIAGGLALGYEVIWSQSTAQFTSTRYFAFSIMLATYLAGIAIGAALFARWVDRTKNSWGTFGLLIATAGFIALLEFALLGPWLTTLQNQAEHAAFALSDNQTVGMCARFAVVALYTVFIPTLLLGAAFPAALKLIVDAGHIGRDVGKVAALNTIGGIVGTTVTGFVLVPHFGLITSLSILAITAALLGVIAAWRGAAGWRGARGGTIAVALAAIIIAVLTPADRLAKLLGGTRGGTIISYQEGQGGTIAVLEQAAGSKKFRRLYIQGVSNTGDTLPSRRYMRLQALLPLLIHNGEPTSALVIGFGTGITAGALLQYPGLEHRVVAELLPEVPHAAHYFQGNYSAANDPRLDIRLRDGRRELLSNSQTYDLITLEPPPPSAAGVANLYSTDFYVMARNRLRPNGIVAQWLPLPTQNDEDTQSLMRSFLDVYPYTSLWTTELHEMLMVGSMSPLVLDVPRISARFNQPDVVAALRDVGVATPAALLANWVTDRAGMKSYVGNAPPVTDDRPRIEYGKWVRSDELQRVLPRLMELRTEPPLRNADMNFNHLLLTERQRLHLFYQASLNAYAGHRDLWAKDMQQVLTGDSNNAYYHWFGGTEN